MRFASATRRARSPVVCQRRKRDSVSARWGHGHRICDGGEGRASIAAGEELLKCSGPSGDFDGQIAVLVQQGTAEFRRIAQVK